MQVWLTAGQGSRLMGMSSVAACLLQLEDLKALELGSSEVGNRLPVGAVEDARGTFLAAGLACRSHIGEGRAQLKLPDT